MQKQCSKQHGDPVSSWFSMSVLRTMLKLLFYSFLGWQFGQMFWLGEKHFYVDHLQVYGVMEKPLVFRQLVPMLTRVLIWVTGVRVDVGLVLIISLSAVAAMVALGLFFREFVSQKKDLHELVSAVILFVFLIKDAKIYDFATVATFTLCLVLLHRQKFWQFLLVYFLACLNRETTFLLTVFFAYHFFRHLDTKTYAFTLLAQVLIFFSVRITMLIAFQENPGVNAQFNFFNNFHEFAGSPVGTLVVLAVFVVVSWLIARNWQSAPKFLKDVVLTFTPILFLMWILFGRAFELRVFLEMFPALYMVIMFYPKSRLLRT